jgi:hypothetical protein
MIRLVSDAKQVSPHKDNNIIKLRKNDKVTHEGAHDAKKKFSLWTHLCSKADAEEEC